MANISLYAEIKIVIVVTARYATDLLPSILPILKLAWAWRSKIYRHQKKKKIKEKKKEKKRKVGFGEG